MFPCKWLQWTFHELSHHWNVTCRVYSADWSKSVWLWYLSAYRLVLFLKKILQKATVPCAPVLNNTVSETVARIIFGIIYPLSILFQSIVRVEYKYWQLRWQRWRHSTFSLKSAGRSTRSCSPRSNWVSHVSIVIVFFSDKMFKTTSFLQRNVLRGGKGWMTDRRDGLFISR